MYLLNFFGPEIMVLSFALGLIILPIVCYWKLYERAGKPGWAAIIPFYSTLIMLEIIHKPWYWLLLMFIPFLGIIWAIWAINLFVKSFGKDEAFTVGMILLPFIFLPILAFGDNQYLQLQPQYQHSEILDDDFV